MTDLAAAPRPEAQARADYRLLATAIAKLCTPYTTRVTQRPPGGGRRETVVHHQPLIVMLETAVTARSGGSASTATTNGSVLNSVAAMRVAELHTDVRASWHRLIPSSDVFLPSWRVSLPDLLRIWFETFDHHFRAEQVTAADLHAATFRYTRWVQLIELMFDPPANSEFTAKCPECGKRWHTTPGTADEQERMSAVAIHFARAFATCRECGTVWNGRAELQLLAHGKRKPRPVHDTPQTAP